MSTATTSRNFTFSSEGEYVASCRVEQTVAPTARSIRTYTGVVEVLVGDRHDVYVEDELVGTVSHDVVEVEVGSMLVERETWTATSARNMYESVGNIADEMQAIRFAMGFAR